MSQDLFDVCEVKVKKNQNYLARFFCLQRNSYLKIIWVSLESFSNILLSSHNMGAVQAAYAVVKVTVLVWQIQINRRKNIMTSEMIWEALKNSSYEIIFFSMSCDSKGKYVIIKVFFQTSVKKNLTL